MLYKSFAWKRYSRLEILITFVILDYKESYKSVLSEEDYQKLMAMSEDDNPCLIKLYFKK